MAVGLCPTIIIPMLYSIDHLLYIQREFLREGIHIPLHVHQIRSTGDHTGYFFMKRVQQSDLMRGPTFYIIDKAVFPTLEELRSMIFESPQKIPDIAHFPGLENIIAVKRMGKRRLYQNSKTPSHMPARSV